MDEGMRKEVTIRGGKKEYRMGDKIGHSGVREDSQVCGARGGREHEVRKDGEESVGCGRE